MLIVEDPIVTKKFKKETKAPFLYIGLSLRVNVG